MDDPLFWSKMLPELPSLAAAADAAAATAAAGAGPTRGLTGKWRVGASDGDGQAGRKRPRDEEPEEGN